MAGAASQPRVESAAGRLRSPQPGPSSRIPGTRSTRMPPPPTINICPASSSRPESTARRLPAPQPTMSHSRIPQLGGRAGMATPSRPTTGAVYKRHGQLVQYKPPPTATQAKPPSQTGRVWLQGYGYTGGAATQSRPQPPAPSRARSPAAAAPTPSGTSLVDAWLAQSRPPRPPAAAAPSRKSPQQRTGMWLPGYGRAGPDPYPDAHRTQTPPAGYGSPSARRPEPHPDIGISLGVASPDFYSMSIAQQMAQLPSKPAASSPCPASPPPRSRASPQRPPPARPPGGFAPRRGSLVNSIIPIKSFQAMGQDPYTSGSGCPAAAGPSAPPGARSGVPVQKESYTRRVRSVSRSKVKSPGAGGPGPSRRVEGGAGQRAICPAGSASASAVSPPASRIIPPFTSPPGIRSASPGISPPRATYVDPQLWSRPGTAALDSSPRSRRPATAPSSGGGRRPLALSPTQLGIRDARQHMKALQMTRDAQMLEDTAPPWSTASDGTLTSRSGPRSPSPCPGVGRSTQLSRRTPSPHSSQAASVVIQNLKSQEEYELSSLIKNLGDMQSYRRKIVGSVLPNTAFLQEVATPQQTSPSSWKLIWEKPEAATSRSPQSHGSDLMQFSSPQPAAPAYGGYLGGAYSKELFDLVKL